jgi:hypothetical protein
MRRLGLEPALARLEELFRDTVPEVCSKVDDCYWNRATDLHRIKRPRHGCCSDCGKTRGYFSFSVCRDSDTVQSNAQHRALQEMFGFSEENGYFDPDKKECKLPRQLRSITCLAFVCQRLQNAMVQKFGGGAIEWYRVDRDIRRIDKARRICGLGF